MLTITVLVIDYIRIRRAKKEFLDILPIFSFFTPVTIVIDFVIIAIIFRYF